MKKLNVNSILGADRGSSKGSASIGGISKGERIIQKTLNTQLYKFPNVRFYRESKYADCRGGANNLPLPFDFSIYIGGNLVALIEFQGVQHSVPTFGYEDWNKTKANDEIKRNYCKEKNIPLLEVPYHKFKNIDDIVINFLRTNGIFKKARG